MITPFWLWDWLTIGDMERNPHDPGTRHSREWSVVDDRRLLLIALDRYALLLRERGFHGR
jgi:hypothetical protein